MVAVVRVPSRGVLSDFRVRARGLQKKQSRRCAGTLRDEDAKNLS